MRLERVLIAARKKRRAFSFPLHSSPPLEWYNSRQKVPYGNW